MRPLPPRLTSDDVAVRRSARTKLEERRRRLARKYEMGNLDDAAYEDKRREIAVGSTRLARAAARTCEAGGEKSVGMASLEGGKDVFPTQIIRYWRPYVITRRAGMQPT